MSEPRLPSWSINAPSWTGARSYPRLWEEHDAVLSALALIEDAREALARTRPRPAMPWEDAVLDLAAFDAQVAEVRARLEPVLVNERLAIEVKQGNAQRQSEKHHAAFELVHAAGLGDDHVEPVLDAADVVAYFERVLGDRVHDPALAPLFARVRAAADAAAPVAMPARAPPDATDEESRTLTRLFRAVDRIASFEDRRVPRAPPGRKREEADVCSFPSFAWVYGARTLRALGLADVALRRPKPAIEDDDDGYDDAVAAVRAGWPVLIGHLERCAGLREARAGRDRASALFDALATHPARRASLAGATTPALRDIAFDLIAAAPDAKESRQLTALVALVEDEDDADAPLDRAVVATRDEIRAASKVINAALTILSHFDDE